jgi:hypothetical protein
MPSNPLIVITLLFLLSFTAAVVLFAFFKSTAVIRSTKYQAGGAIAGFMLVYGILYPSYQRVANDKNLQKLEDDKSVIKQLEVQNKQLHEQEDKHQQFETPRDISGTVFPNRGRIKVVLAFTDGEVRTDNKFRLSAPCVDVRNRPYTLYVIGNGVSYPYVIQPDENVSALNIGLP